MGKNINSTSGQAEDLIRSLVQLACIELHLKTLIEKDQSELDNGVIDTFDFEVVKANRDSMKENIDELVTITEMRREDMNTLYKMFGSKGDLTQWCIIKHAAMAMYTAFETWQASDLDDEFSNDLFISYMNKNAYFTKKMAQFLGVTIVECASCFSDILKAEENKIKEIEDEN